jgi:hypothetical protein
MLSASSNLLDKKDDTGTHDRHLPRDFLTKAQILTCKYKIKPNTARPGPDPSVVRISWTPEHKGLTFPRMGLSSV